MNYRGRIDDPGVMQTILDDIKSGPIEFWLDILAGYENEKPGDVVLPGIPPGKTRARQPSATPFTNAGRAKKRHPKRREAV